MGLVPPGTEIVVFFKIVLSPLAGLVSPGTEIGVFSKIVLFNIVFFNVAFTKSSNIAGILWVILWAILWVILWVILWAILWVIRKRLVEFRLDFLAFIRID